MKENDKHLLEKNDKVLSIVKTVYDIAIPAFCVIFFVTGILLLFISIWFTLFCWIFSIIILPWLYLLINLNLNYYYDIKLIRNKLYEIESNISIPPTPNIDQSVSERSSTFKSN